eukprot:11210011-Lingulodinium_polyedra.AAC.1
MARAPSTGAVCWCRFLCFPRFEPRPDGQSPSAGAVCWYRFPVSFQSLSPVDGTYVQSASAPAFASAS